MGVWAQTGFLTFEINHFPINYDPSTGMVASYVNLREQDTLSPSGDSYKGTLTIDVYDPMGNHVDHLAGTVAATRLTVDSALPAPSLPIEFRGHAQAASICACPQSLHPIYGPSRILTRTVNIGYQVTLSPAETVAAGVFPNIAQPFSILGQRAFHIHHSAKLGARVTRRKPTLTGDRAD